MISMLMIHLTYQKIRKILFYSGHMETRKGVGVLVNAAKYLYNQHNKRDFHFLILGNKGGEEKQYMEMLADEGARNHVTFVVIEMILKK